MKPFQKKSQSGNRYGDKRFGARSPGAQKFGDREAIKMYKATCGQCGAQCEVPFKPLGKKPVLCGSCFKKDGDIDTQRPSGGRLRRSSFNDRRAPGAQASIYNNRDTRGQGDELRKINAKLDAILKLLS